MQKKVPGNINGEGEPEPTNIYVVLIPDGRVDFNLKWGDDRGRENTRTYAQRINAFMPVHGRLRS